MSNKRGMDFLIEHFGSWRMDLRLLEALVDRVAAGKSLNHDEINEARRIIQENRLATEQHLADTNQV